jgi:hypothetical protein
MRERRLEAAHVMEANSIVTLTNFIVTEKSALHAQSATVPAALAPTSGAGATITTTTVSSTSNGISDKNSI